MLNSAKRAVEMRNQLLKLQVIESDDGMEELTVVLDNPDGAHAGAHNIFHCN